MKAFKVLVVLGGILVVIGLLLAVGAPKTLSKDSTFAFPGGAGYYYEYTLSGMFTGEQLTFNYVLNSTGSVDVYLLSADGYSSYSYDLTVPSSLYANPGSTSGAGSVVIPADGTYYLVVNHGSDSSALAQSGQMTIRATGLNVTVLAVGIALMVIGAVVLAVGYRMRSKAQPAPPGFASTSQVTLFPRSGQELPPPPQPPPESPPRSP